MMVMIMKTMKTNRPPCLCSQRNDIRCDDTHCDLAGPGAPGDPNQCRICWQFHHNREYNLLWGGNGNVTPNPELPSTLQRSRLPCTHLGTETGERLLCSSCLGTVYVKAHHCRLHSRCVLGTTITGVYGCYDCPDHREPAVVENIGQRRNLLFHLYPIRENAVWHWHVDMLRQYIHLFNGKKVLALVFDVQTEDPNAVKNALNSLFDEILEFPNDPSLREVLTFEPLFNRIRSINSTEVTLYAHGKGVGRYAHSCVRRWSELLYELNMTHWNDIQRLLIRSPICGSFKKVGRGWPDSESLVDWHYSGSWFWFRNRDLFLQREWRKIDHFWSGIESYPGLHFKPEHAACLFHEARVPDMNLYNENTWKNQIEPAYSTFQQQKQPYPLPSGLKVELGGGEHRLGNEWTDIDRSTGYNLECDKLPFEDDSVAEVYTSHCLEHIHNLHHVLHEIVRVCKIGAAVTIIVPHWLSAMSTCHDHKQVIPPEQIDHWTKTALNYWWKGCKKRLTHIRTTQIPSSSFNEAKTLFPHMTSDQLMRFVPGTAHEVKYELRVVPYEG